MSVLLSKKDRSYDYKKENPSLISEGKDESFVGEFLENSESSHESGANVKNEEIVTLENSLEEESCDFAETNKFVEEFLEREGDTSILQYYSEIELTEQNNKPSSIFINGDYYKGCVLTARFSSGVLSEGEREREVSGFFAVDDFLSLLNPDVNHSGSVLTGKVSENVNFSLMAADGPSGTAMGTYIEEEDGVRLIYVSGGTKRTVSVYEASEDNPNGCPCEDVVTLEITKPLSEKDFVEE